MFVILAGLAIAAAAAYVWGRLSGPRIERQWLAARRLGPDGVIVGAEPIRLAGGPNALLLLHGAGDTPQSLAFLADRLWRRGYTVFVPLLSGHGRSLPEFARHTADDWLVSARVAYSELRSAHAWVGIIGQSMGGALAVRLAAEQRDVPALGLVAPYLAMTDTLAWLARLAPLWGLAHPYPASLDDRSIQDPAERVRGLGFAHFPPGALVALHRTVRATVETLPLVGAPTLMIQSREDNRIAAPAAERAFAALGAREKRLVWVEGCGHVLTVDFCREHVSELLGEWMDAHGGRAAGRHASGER